MQKLAIKWYSWAQARTYQEEGQGVVEYALIVGLVSVVLAVLLATAGGAWIGRVTAGVASALTDAKL